MPRHPYSPPARFDTPAHAAEPLKLTRFRHPGYEGDQQIFLVLPAADHGKTLHHKTAHAACAIIACNSFHGFLSSDRAGTQKVLETQLDGDDYFFQVPIGDGPESQGLDNQYCLYPNFRNWSPQTLPELWERLEIPSLAPSTRSIAGDALIRDGSCRVTLHMEKTQVAHIIPASEEQWYHARGMSLAYTPFQSPENKIVLRPDVHQLIDEPALMIVPREIESTGEETEAEIRLCLHLVRRQRFQRELLELYHNVTLQPLSGINKMFLFCRFALSVFGSMNDFLAAGVARWLAVWDGTRPKAGLKTAEQCRDYVLQSRTRSSSPRKRVRPDDPQNNTNRRVADNVIRSAWLSSLDYQATESDGEQRGRKRVRTSPSATSSNESTSAFASSNVTPPEPVFDDDEKIAIHHSVDVESPVYYGTNTE